MTKIVASPHAQVIFKFLMRYKNKELNQFKRILTNLLNVFSSFFSWELNIEDEKERR